VPHLLPCLTEEPLRPGLVERSQHSVEQSDGRRRRELVVLGGYAAGEDSVDPLVVTLPTRNQGRVVEVFDADDRDERLRQVVVDVGVDPEQQESQGRQVGRRPEGQSPRPGHLTARDPRLESTDVEIREGDVPAVHPRRVLEPALLDLIADGDGRPAVRREEGPLGVEVGRHGLEQPVHPGEDPRYAGQLVRGHRHRLLVVHCPTEGPPSSTESSDGDGGPEVVVVRIVSRRRAHVSVRS
jgi:hypothetical protein